VGDVELGEIHATGGGAQLVQDQIERLAARGKRNGDFIGAGGERFCQQKQDNRQMLGISRNPPAPKRLASGVWRLASGV
jgi:hypothetical protein